MRMISRKNNKIKKKQQKEKEDPRHQKRTINYDVPVWSERLWMTNTYKHVYRDFKAETDLID